MSDDFYSLLLVLALVFLTIAVALLKHRPGPVIEHKLLPAWLSPLAASMALLSVVLGLANHAMLGHPRGTSHALAASDFVAAHPAPLVIGAAGLLLVVLSLRRDAA